MNILVVDSQFPMFNRASVDVRMFAIVRLLVDEGHAVSYFVANAAAQEKAIGHASVAMYREALERRGVTIYERTGWERVLTTARFDAVFFKYFFPAERRIDLIRIWQPKAKVIVDSVDLVYARLLTKADLSGDTSDRRDAVQTRQRELATYARADLVVTVTEEEKSRLMSEVPGLPVHVIPNIHEIPKLPRQETDYPSLVFVGVFSHEPNVDAVLHFATDIWPHVVREVPGVRWTIVGGNPPDQVRALGLDNVEVTGHVPDTLPFLLRSWISIAPLRFGAGMKGKVGEAMAAGTPVVTTSFGAQGFPAASNSCFFVDDDPLRFAARIIELIGNPALRLRVGTAGRRFIEDHYSPGVVCNQVKRLISALQEVRPKSTPLRGTKWLLRAGRLGLHRYVLWRFPT